MQKMQIYPWFELIIVRQTYGTTYFPKGQHITSSDIRNLHTRWWNPNKEKKNVSIKFGSWYLIRCGVQWKSSFKEY